MPNRENDHADYRNTFQCVHATLDHSFVDSGLMEDEAEGKALYQAIIVFSFVIVVPLTPLNGIIADKIRGVWIIPITFAMRCAIGYGFL